MNGWISVADRLPTEADDIAPGYRPATVGISVIAMWDSDPKEISAVTYFGENGGWRWMSGYELESPTHWQPYPKPPEATS